MQWTNENGSGHREGYKVRHQLTASSLHDCEDRSVWTLYQTCQTTTALCAVESRNLLKLDYEPPPRARRPVRLRNLWHACMHRTVRICVAIATQSCISNRGILDGWMEDVCETAGSERGGALTRHDRRSRLRGGEGKGGWDMTCHLCVAEHHYLTLPTITVITAC